MTLRYLLDGSVILLLLLSVAPRLFSGDSSTQLTEGPVCELLPSISPNGEWLSFLKFFPERPMAPELWLAPWSDPSKSKRLSSPDVSVGSTSWSPDSEWIAYISEGQLHKVNIKSGRAFQLTTLPIADPLASAGTSWSLDGEITTLRKCAIIAVNESGGEIREIMRLDSSAFGDLPCPDSLSRSPDGRFVALHALAETIGEDEEFISSSLWLADIESRNVTRLTAGHGDDPPSWIDSTTLLFSRTSPNRTGAVLSLDVISRSMKELASGAFFMGAAVHPDGRWIVASRATRFDLETGNDFQFYRGFHLWKIRPKGNRKAKSGTCYDF